MTLTAPAGAIITSVDYASYGNSTDNGDGTCTLGTCNTSNSRSIVESYALNQNSFSSYASNDTFGDPCFGTGKTLAVVVTYTYSAPLPVELVTFTATATGRAAQLSWTTASALRSAQFEVQRSLTGTDFTTVGTVAAAGSSSTTRNYAFTDAFWPAAATELYYRPRLVDTDGTSRYSPVRSLALPQASPALVLVPNPAQGSTRLSGAPALAPVRLPCWGRK